MIHEPCRHCRGRQQRHAGGLCGLCGPCHRDPETRGRPLPAPTAARRGSAEKLAVLCDRAASGQELWHPLDNALPALRPRPSLRVKQSRGVLCGHATQSSHGGARGLCGKCYQALLNAVRYGRDSWERAEREGRCLPRKCEAG